MCSRTPHWNGSSHDSSASRTRLLSLASHFLFFISLAFLPLVSATPLWDSLKNLGQQPVHINTIQVGSYASVQITDRIPWDEGKAWRPEVAESFVGKGRSYRLKHRIEGKIGTAFCSASQLYQTISHFRPRRHQDQATSAPSPNTTESMLKTYQEVYANVSNTQAPLAIAGSSAAQMVPGPQGANAIPQVRLTEMIMRHVQYTALTYCSREAAGGMSQVTIPGVQGGGLLLGNFTILQWVPVKDLLYYVAVNPQQKAIHVVFRGSDNKDNFRRDANGTAITPSSTLFPGAPQGARVHGGMHEATKLLFDQNLSSHIGLVLEPIIRRYTGYGVVVSGHSLGGGLAALAALVLTLQPPKGMQLSALYTYGQPILGNAIFTDWLGKEMRNDRYARVVSSNDIAPYFTYSGWRTDLDPDRMKRHSKNIDEVYMPRWTQPVVQLCQGDADPLCSENMRCTVRDWDHHSWYGGQWAGENFCLLGHTPDRALTDQRQKQKDSGPMVLPYNPVGNHIAQNIPMAPGLGM
ncbi:Alpha/Beta hydrolase protein [Piptocephalis cylindrospora]|uniref:Alpha/Beta hydrolase protein n=1 Tax=Piptocephalis cylindrospora TaxID=1907219 RepID=A0A4P9XY82_9FUNG|nr:Alpha/Beta hydrolase protein [Piptocephalis cylindrospora]|eukprot:RKP11365.1 Alpha/Beta hydrolase protein [Piptocephalis cylindrospora]